MASISDYLSMQNQTPLGFQLADMTPQYRVNETAPALREDASIAATRGTQDFQQRTTPDLVNAAAAAGNYGSSGFKDRLGRATVDYRRNQNDISRMLYRNLASIARQRIMATTGSML